MIQSVEEIRRTHDRSWITQAAHFNASVSVESANAYGSAGLVHMLDSQLDADIRAVANASELIVNRESAISDYLRDAASGLSNRMNLELQRSLRRLTWSSVIIALIALFIALAQLIGPAHTGAADNAADGQKQVSGKPVEGKR